MQIRAALNALVLLAGAACATSPSQTTAGAEAPAAQTSRSTPSIITEQELASGNFQSVYEAIEQLRPQFFRGRGRSDNLGRAVIPTVYINNNRSSGAESLRSLSVSGVREIRYLTDLQANQRFGDGHDNGAIVVTLK